MSGSGATAAISPSPLQITCLVYAFMGNSKQMSYGPETVAAMLVGTFPFCSPRSIFLYIIFNIYFSFFSNSSVLFLGLTIQDKDPSDPAAFAHILSFMVCLYPGLALDQLKLLLLGCKACAPVGVVNC
jgi:hypothetical protein